MQKQIISFLTWVKPSFEGTNQTASSRRLTAFAVWVIYAIGRVYFILTVKDAWYLLLGSVVDGLFILLLFGIIVFQNVTELIQGYKKSKEG